MNKLYKTVQQATPPIIFNAFKHSSLYQKAKPTLKKLFDTKLPPQWNQVNTGILKGTWLYFYPLGDWQEKMLKEEYDKELFGAIRKFDLKGKTIFDIGSHVGYHSIFFSKLVGPNGKVLAFEPNPFNAKRIQENIDKNSIKNIKVCNIALSSENSETDFLFSENIENGTSSGGFIEASDTFYSKDSYESGIGFKRMKVATKRIDDLDEIKKGKMKVDVMKIDVEGAESLVFDGAMATIKKDRPIILIEIHSMTNMYYFLNMLQDINYSCELLKRENDGRHLLMARSK